MRLTLNSNCVLKSDRLSVGYCEENKAETLNIFIQNEKLYDKEIRLEFQVNSGSKYTTDELELFDGHIEYSLPNGLLSESGTLSLQLVFREQNGLVKKSNVLKLHIHKSICAGDELAKEYPDFIGEAQKVVDECEKLGNECEKLIDEGQVILKDCQEATEKVKTYSPAIIDVENTSDITKEKSFYRVKKVVGGEYQGTAIPDTGRTSLDDFIYPNFNLSIEETVSYLEQLTLDNSNTYDVLILQTASVSQFSALQVEYSSSQNKWEISLGTGIIFDSENGWCEDWESILEDAKSFVKILGPSVWTSYPIEKLTNNQNELIKNVISNTPIEYVEEVKYPIYHTKNGQLIELEEVKEETITFIDVSSDVPTDQYGIQNLTLDKKGTYIIGNDGGMNYKPLMINFGLCKHGEIGKFINVGSGVDSYYYIDSGFCSGSECGSYMSMSDETLEYNRHLYIVVNDNDVFINLTKEV